MHDYLNDGGGNDGCCFCCYAYGPLSALYPFSHKM
jgi:hypothetical protein